MESGSCCGEWKKVVYLHNLQPMETWFVRIMLNENTIMSWRTMPPRIDSLNTFTKHAPHARQVTWGIINGNRRRKTQIFMGPQHQCLLYVQVFYFCLISVLYHPPHNPHGLHWIPLDSTGLHWTGLDCQLLLTQNWTPLDCQLLSTL